MSQTETLPHLAWDSSLCVRKGGGGGGRGDLHGINTAGSERHLMGEA